MRWGHRHPRPPFRKARRTRLAFETLEPREVPHVSGLVFIDLNQDGIQDVDDVGVAGVTVRATDDTGAVQTVTTEGDGSYEIETDAANVRLEFSGLPDGTMPGRVVDTSGPVVRFLDAQSDRSDVNLSLASPRLVTTQFFYDHARTGANSWQGAVLAFPYQSSDSISPVPLANVSDVGSVWGLAYQPSSNSVYASAFLKRHAGFGPNAAGTAVTTGGIYRIDPTADEPGAKLLVDLNAAGFDTGANPHPAQSEEKGGDWFHDANAVGLIGKRSLGGLAVAPDGSALYTVNLNTRELITVPLKPDGTRDTSRPITSVPVPLTNPAGSGIGAANFNAANVRPFAVTVKGNAVFVGVTYTAETTQNAADLRAFVYAYDPAQKAFRGYDQKTGTFAAAGAATPVLAANLTYPRGSADDPTPGVPGDEASADWQPWTSTFDTSLTPDGLSVHPQPWLTDIVFDGDAMVLGLRDRFGDQAGYMTGSADSGDDGTPYLGLAVGDILRAAPSGAGGWQLESGAKAGGLTTGGAGTNQGPGGGEYYFQDSADGGPDEVMTGGLAQVPGFHTVAATGNDPLEQFDGGIYEFFNSDPDASTPVAGTVAAKGEVYSTFDSSTFGNANGLGDLEAIPTSGTVEVGDRVFNDTNANGIQDAGEPGLAGVNVQLFRGDSPVATAATDASGNFLFTGLIPNSAYSIRIDTTQAALAGKPLAPANKGASDELDSDATLTGTTAIATFTSPLEGTTDHSLDVGFVGKQQAAKLTLGDTVFQDTNNNGKRDAGEPGLAHVAVDLLNATGATVLASTDTDAAGAYAFSGLDPGSYIVRLAASNFTGTGPLVGFTSGTHAVADPNNNVNDDNNGAPGAGGTIVSGPITLTANGEPTTDGDTDPNTNRTLDFGVVQSAPTPARASLAGRVILDFDNSGRANGPDTGIAGVTIALSGGGPGSWVTVTTDAQGNFSFTDLAAGTYTLTESQPTTPANQTGKDTAGTAGGSPATANAIANIVLGAGQSATGYTFAEVPLVSTGGAVFEDQNGNGTKDPGEPGIPGVTVTLTGTSAVTGAIASKTAVTDVGGNYSFTGLTPGTYTLTETQPAAYLDGNDQNGAPAGTASNDAFAGIELTAAAAPSGGFNFGEVRAASLAGVVFTDANDDGTQAASGEPGIAGVTIRLTGTDDRGQAVNATATTAADGSYSFNGLRPGSYAVSETQPTGFTDGKDAAGTAGGTVTATGDQIGGIQLSSGATATGYRFGERAATSAPADLVLTVSPTSVSIARGGTVTLTYTLRNAGPATATAAAVVMDYGGLAFVSSPTAPFNPTTRTWTVGDLAPGATQTLKVVLRATAAGTFHSSATASTTATESSTADNAVTSTVTARAIPAPRPVTPPPSRWFLSSSTHARRTPR